ncbi:MAG TPA: electron transport complex subunit RsxC, partial [Chromatiales bacterium]|nr:electron transport complex subunit RsxC [Chromatiales bacterium]
LEPLSDYTALSPARIRRRVRQCGIVGLGGAAFPTAAKINPLHEQRIHTLVLNGAECEPYITCDDTLLRHFAQEVLEGARILLHALDNPERCIIAVEEDMPEAYEAVREALGGVASGPFRLVRVPAIYPTGSEKQLIHVLTGLEVPADGLPADIGVICQNVGTVRAVYRAVVHGEPLIERIVTVTGRGVRRPGNHWVRLGTPVEEVIRHAGGYVEDVEWLLMGGPMMGIALHEDVVPTVKATNCLLVARKGELPAAGTALPCIRCGECVRVCPARLLPQEMYRLAKAREFDRIQEYDLFDCIECGCCAYVCPSHLPLVHYYRYAKSEIRDLEREREAAERARRRHEFRLERLEREKRERAARMARKKAAVSAASGKQERQAAIEAAVKRAEAKKTARRQTAQTED